MKVLSTEDAVACLRRIGVPVTQPRIEIARTLFSRPVHLTAEQVLQEVRARAPRVSRATVYNTLKLFCDKKLLQELHVDPERSVFDSNARPHHHLYDVDSGEVHDLPLGHLELPSVLKLGDGGECEVLEAIIHVRRRSC